jgi:hypothetical protein
LRQRALHLASIAALSLGLGAPAALRAEEPGSAAEAEAPGGAAGPPEVEGPPPVALEQLLKLPDSFRTAPLPSRGGATRSEWRVRFEGARQKLEAERAALQGARGELEEVAGSAEAWQVGPPIPGAQAGDAPLDYRLRQQIRRHREQVEVLEQELRDLEVEANLAGVPEDWRE